MADHARLRLLTRIIRFGLLLVVTVIALGAWTRLRDAGLGCPDWPTCYGHLTVPTSSEALARAAEAFPGQVVEPDKAWPETIHRYFAAGIGAVLVVIAFLALQLRHLPGMPWRHALGLLVLVCVQGGFGALTVTEKLYPPVVTGHLLLGFTTFSLLWLLHLRLHRAFPPLQDAVAGETRPLTTLAILLLVMQILLGGWTASNYAAAVCTELPVCQSGWQQVLDPVEAFTPFHPDDRSYEYAPHLGTDAKVTIHVAHRLGAVIVSAVLILLGSLLLRARHRRYRRFGLLVLAGLGVQVALGVVNVSLGLPLANAVAHNVWAAILLQLLIALRFAQAREHRGGLSWH